MEDFDKSRNSSENGFTPNYTPLDPWVKNAPAEEASSDAPRTQAPAGEAPRQIPQNPGTPAPDPAGQTASQATADAQSFAQQPPLGPQPQQSAYSPRPQEASQYRPEPRPQPTQQGQNGFSADSSSGEYRYVPPFAQSYDPRPHQQRMAPPQPPQPPRPQEPKKEKKSKSGRSLSTAAIVLIVCATVLLSFGSGMAGALIMGGNSLTADGNTSAVGGSSNGGGVIYKSPVTLDEDEKADGLSDLCGLVSDSVVEITTEYKKSYGNFQYVNGGAGSGVIISTDGYVITNNHVITDEETGRIADAVKVRLTDGTEYDAKVIGHDSDSDIAVIKINAQKLSAATLGSSDSLKVGERVIAVGNPLGELGGTVTSGIISATNREISVDNNMMNLIQIDAAINPGNSGGGLFNMKGELIGIVNAKSTGSNVEGLGFAIPIDEAGSVAEELISNGYVSGKSYVGISLTDVTDNFTAYYYFRSQSTGVYITQVQEGYNDGVLEYGDRITAIDGEEISTSADVKEIVKSHKVGDEMKFTVSRDGKMKDVTVKCYEYVPQSDVTFGED